jgi:hypothetical protein
MHIKKEWRDQRTWCEQALEEHLSNINFIQGQKNIVLKIFLCKIYFQSA